MAEFHEIWVFSEKPALLGELIAGAQGLTHGGQVIAVVMGPQAHAQLALARGAASVLWLGDYQEGALVDDCVPTLASLVEQNKPYALLIGATKRGRAIAGRLAARLDVTVLTDALEFLYEEDQLQVRHMIFGGGAVRVDRPLATPMVITVGPGTFAVSSLEMPADLETPPDNPSELKPTVADLSKELERPAYDLQPPQVASAAAEIASESPSATTAPVSGQIVQVSWIEPPVKLTLRERKSRPKAAVNLFGARRVVCAGRGLAKQEDLQMVSELAHLMGAELACTRPLAEGLDWLPRERYLGISGATIRPDLYLGVGVSGQVQHMIGMNNSGVVVAINKDQNAPIFANADYGIVADLYAIVPALIKALQNR